MGRRLRINVGSYIFLLSPNVFSESRLICSGFQSVTSSVKKKQVTKAFLKSFRKGRPLKGPFERKGLVLFRVT